MNNGWTLWLDLVAEEYNYRRVLSGDTLPISLEDTQASAAITDVFELDTEPYRLSLDTPRYPTLLDSALDYLKEGGDDGTILQ